MTQSHARGYFFEEFSVGQEVESPARTVTEADVVQFAGLSGDYNQLHTDAEFARKTPYGKRIAHGLLGLSIASGLAARTGFIEGTAQAFIGLTWKFKAPIFFGDTIRLRARVMRTRSMPRMTGGMVVFAITILNQDDKRVQQGEWTLLLRGRPNTQDETEAAQP
ncbi:MAG TPA: MaoC/PaaZ C-terminal domain-containing protein [Anaerolineae bacterium]|nr:MaoC/PaaZ C-terminal domain-containing protein [Anaerolineae bacterium]